MIPAPFEYYSPSSLEEAIELLERFGNDAKLLAGGQSLIPMMKLRIIEPKVIIDLNRVPGLSYIREEGGFLRIGALTRYYMVEESDLVRRRYPLLYEAVSQIADPVVRNMGTVGGNVCHSDPANDLPAVMLAYGAEMVAVGPSGERVIGASEFFRGPYQTDLRPGEILKEIRIPQAKPRSGGAYLKLERRAGDFAIAASAVQVVLDSSDRFEYVGIALTSLGPTAIKVDAAEKVLLGRSSSNLSSINEAAELAYKAAEPVSDLRGPEWYKREMAKVLTKRALLKAVERARSFTG